MFTLSRQTLRDFCDTSDLNLSPHFINVIVDFMIMDIIIIITIHILAPNAAKFLS